MNRTAVAIMKSKKETWVVALCGCLVVLAALYVYFLSVSIVHVVMRQETVQEIKEQQSRIAALEREYIAAQHTLSASVASLEGYTAVNEKVFISRTESSLVLGGANTRR